jgi:hypothetical protein
MPDDWRCGEEIRSKGGGWRLKKMPQVIYTWSRQVGFLRLSVAWGVLHCKHFGLMEGDMHGDLTSHHSPVSTIKEKGVLW